MRTASGALVCAAVLGLAACGGGNGAASCTPGPTAALTITASGVNPQNVCVAPQGTVTFTNSDTVSHHIEFDGNCPALAQLAPGAQGSVTFPTEGNCSFHDSAAGAAFQGVVAVTTATVSGGY
ncbi:MAG: hypothetical protein ACJ79R_23740 [Anaeromyxobacteraceae bacterium]